MKTRFFDLEIEAELVYIIDVGYVIKPNSVLLNGCTLRDVQAKLDRYIEQALPMHPSEQQEAQTMTIEEWKEMREKDLNNTTYCVCCGR